MTREGMLAFMARNGLTQAQAAKVFGTTQGNVNAIVRGQRKAMKGYYSRIYSLLSLFTPEQQTTIINSIIGG